MYEETATSKGKNCCFILYLEVWGVAYSNSIKIEVLL